MVRVVVIAEGLGGRGELPSGQQVWLRVKPSNVMVFGLADD